MHLTYPVLSHKHIADGVVVPELRSIKRVGWTEHMENAGQNGLYAGAPSETNAEAWELLLQRQNLSS